MRTSLARYDGWLSAVRSHPGPSLECAARQNIQEMSLYRYNPPIKWFPLIRTMTGVIAIHPSASSVFEKEIKETVVRF